MKVRLTRLNAGEYFTLDDITYKKMENREHGQNVENVDTGEVRKLPLMVFIDKVEPDEVKPKKKKVASKAVKKRVEKTEDVVDKVEGLADKTLNYDSVDYSSVDYNSVDSDSVDNKGPNMEYPQ